MELRGAVCLVTGASNGIGRSSAMRLAGAGAKLLIVGRDERKLQEVASVTGGWPIRADLSVPDEVDRVAAEAVSAAGRVDALVNNAGEGWAGSFSKMEVEQGDRLVRTNLLAPMRLTRALLPGMLERGMGMIVNVASIAGHVGVREEAVYSATKAALIAFSESLRYELAGTGVGVSVVSPGTVATAFFDRRGRGYDRRFPRPIHPDRVAETVLRALRTGRPQLFVPRWLAFPAWLKGTIPALYRSLAGRFG